MNRSERRMAQIKLGKEVSGRVMELFNSGRSVSYIASELGIRESTVRNIVSRRSGKND